MSYDIMSLTYSDVYKTYRYNRIIFMSKVFYGETGVVLFQLIGGHLCPKGSRVGCCLEDSYKEIKGKS